VLSCAALCCTVLLPKHVPAASPTQPCVTPVISLLQSITSLLCSSASYFATWKHKGQLEQHRLPAEVAELTGQGSVPFGDGVLRLADAVLASETCEELFTPQ
jgi:hypothetical protein